MILKITQMIKDKCIFCPECKCPIKINTIMIFECKCKSLSAECLMGGYCFNLKLDNSIITSYIDELGSPYSTTITVNGESISADNLKILNVSKIKILNQIKSFTLL